MRKRWTSVVGTSLQAKISTAARLPEQLRESLGDMRQTVHDLKYGRGAHESSATRVQAWWRSILARRVVRVLAVARACAQLHARLRGAATRIQSWIRKTIAVRRFQPLIERGLLERQARRIQEQMAGIRATILLQSAFRRRLARRRVEEVRRLQQQREEPKQDWFDSERPLSPPVRPWSSASAVRVSSKSFCRPGSPGTLSVYAAETTQSGWRPWTTSRGSPDTDLGWGMRETPDVDLDPGWRPRTRGTPDDDPGGPLSPHQSWRTPPPSGRVSPRYSLRTPGRTPTPGGDLGMRTTDSWKPSDSRPVDFNAVTTHKSEFELDKLDDSGLVPFYWSQDSELVRHRVGGPVAWKMERWLAADDSDGGGPEELSMFLLFVDYYYCHCCYYYY